MPKDQIMERSLYKDIVAKGEARGELRIRAETIVGILTHRIGALDPAVRERVRGATDLTALAAWYQEALLVVDADGARRLADKILHAPLV
jgi:hypothetical protein